MEQDKKRRLAAVKTADAVNKIEGVPISPQARQLSAQWARGEITGDEMKSALLAAHKHPNKDGKNKTELANPSHES